VPGVLGMLALGTVLGAGGRSTLSPQVSGSTRAPAGTEKAITISFVGDIMLAGAVGKKASERGTEHLLASVGDVLQRDDLTLGNLECAVARRGAPQEKEFTFRADPDLLAGLARGGIDAVSLANNHALDYGRAALLDTLAHLREAGIAAAGAGADLDAASRPTILSVGDKKIAFIAASRVLPTAGWYAAPDRPGIAPAYDPARLLHEIGTARRDADLVVVYVHWGEEGATIPATYQRTLARRCVDAGADLVVGAHPHVLQGFEYYKGKLIAYSLGNFLFRSQAQATAILQTTFAENRSPTAVVLPCRVQDYRPQCLTDGRARADALRALEQRSFGVTISPDGLIAPAQ
jgi:poly-gamma-glutamate capsule biosynthesis protein CapA/YwtB (metallophosphatase superfamily)